MEIYKEPLTSTLCCRRSTYTVASKSHFHWHKKIEICQALSEGCTFYVDGQKIVTNPGDIVFINEYNIHQFIMEDNATVRFVQLTIDILLNLRIPISPIKKHITKEELLSVEGMDEKLNTVFDLIEQEGSAGNILENPYLCNLASALYFLLMRHFPDVKTSTSISPDRLDFYQVTEYINTHYAENINVESIAKSLLINRGKLPKLFAKYAETDVMTYVNSLRVNHANILLKSGTDITEAALLSGFSSIRTFNNVYKKIMGITPSEYLKNGM